MIDAELLEILVCPETRQAVHMADGRLLAQVNDAIAGGDVTNRGGEPVRKPLDGGLVREDGEFLYPVRDDIPVMLIDEAIPLASLQGPRA